MKLMTIQDKVNQWRGIKPATQPKVTHDTKPTGDSEKGSSPTDTTGSAASDTAAPIVVAKPSNPTTPKVVITTKGKSNK